MSRVEFWYDFASTYSYLTAVRIEGLAAGAGAEVVWRPFLLGPIFQAQGWTTSPFQIYPAKGRYMIRDMQRLAADRGLVFHMPIQFPQNGLKAARMALDAAGEGAIGSFTRAVFEAEFAHSQVISESEVLVVICAKLGLDFARLFRRSEMPETKQALRAQTERAQALGVFGAPSFVTADGELFWGDDRLEYALAHAARL